MDRYEEDGGLEIKMPIEIYYILLKMLPSSIISINEIFSTKI
jgi:hypothetical protein